jgi:hypothetical protein
MVTYYHIEISSTGYSEKNRRYDCYIVKDASSNVVKSRWLKTHENNDIWPDFMWRPHPIDDLTKKSCWKLPSRPSNPEVDPQVVYDIYMQSL